jgi:hypothetical protein
MEYTVSLPLLKTHTHASVDRADEHFFKENRESRGCCGLAFYPYNFARIHKALRIAPATATGIFDHVWSDVC